MRLAGMPSLAVLSDVPDRQRRDGPPELVVGCKHPVIPATPCVATGGGLVRQSHDEEAVRGRRRPELAAFHS